MAVPVKPRVSQIARASWIGLARARSLYAEFSLGRITGADVLRRNRRAVAALALAARNDVAGLPDPCGATPPIIAPSGSSFRTLVQARGREAVSLRRCADPAVEVARAVAAMTGLRLASLAVLIMFFVGSRAGGPSGSCAFAPTPTTSRSPTSGRRASRTGSRSWSPTSWMPSCRTHGGRSAAAVTVP